MVAPVIQAVQLENYCRLQLKNNRMLTLLLECWTLRLSSLRT